MINSFVTFVAIMNIKMEISERFNELNCCVIVPTYNNATVIGEVINKLKKYTQNIIVVNDGSTDNTISVLANCSTQFVSYVKNKGKGYALRKGFDYAFSKGYKFAITIDSDGQHNPDDLVLFLNEIEDNRRAIILGARNMEQASVPAKSSFGNKFSNFWFWVETGYRVPDTQTGYRCYPLKYVANKKYFTNKYEFEIEVMVRGVWSGLKIKSVPVSVYYPPKEERISHFRPFKDFTRISILNTFLVLVLLLYIKPRDLFLIIKNKSFRSFLRENVLKSTDSNNKMALSVTLGVFMGIAPVWGWQMLIAVFFAHILKLNKAVTLIASNISIPPMIPLLLYFSYLAGGYVLPNGITELSFSNISFDKVYTDLFQYLIGSLVFGALLSVVGGIVTLVLLKIFRRGN